MGRARISSVYPTSLVDHISRRGKRCSLVLFVFVVNRLSPKDSQSELGPTKSLLSLETSPKRQHHIRETIGGGGISKKKSYTVQAPKARRIVKNQVRSRAIINGVALCVLNHMTDRIKSRRTSTRGENMCVLDHRPSQSPSNPHGRCNPLTASKTLRSSTPSPKRRQGRISYMGLSRKGVYRR